MKRRFPVEMSELQSSFVSIEEIANTLGIEPKFIDNMLSGSPGYPDIGEGIKFERRQYSVGNIFVSTDSYEIFSNRLKNVAEKAKKKIALMNKVQELENEIEPEFQTSSSNVIAPDGQKYFYFKPSRMCELGLFNEEDLTLFKEDRAKSLLSLGAGKGYLEKILIKLGLEPQQVVVSDIDPKVLPQELNSVAFDFRVDWPFRKGKTFDLIIFPESLGVSVEDKNKLSGQDFSSEKINLSIKVLNEASEYLIPNGEIRISGSNLGEEELKVRESELSPLKIIYHNEPLLVLKKC